MFLSWKSLGNVTVGGLNTYEVATNVEDSAETGAFLNVEGRQLGIFPWLLEKTGLADPTFRFAIAHDFITFVKGNKEYTLVPTQEIHSVSVGYSRNKMLLIAAIAFLLMGFFFLLVSIGEGEAGIAVPALLGIIAGGICWWRYKFSEKLEIIATTLSPDRVRASFGVKLKSTMTGAKVTEEQLGQTLSVMMKICQMRSKHY